MKSPWVWLAALIFAPILLFPWDGNTVELPGDAYANEPALTVQAPSVGLVLAQAIPELSPTQQRPAPSSSGMSEDQKLKAWGIGALIAFLILLVLGMTNRVVIFQDGADFGWSLMTLITPLATFMILGMMAPENAPPDYDHWAETYGKVVIIVGGLVTLFSVVRMFVYSIASNGLLLGLVIGVFKLVASMISIVFAIGFINKLFDDDRKSYGAWALLMLVGAAFVWVLTKLINGDDVEARRLAQGTP
jgi:hypothetical protein